MHRLSGLVLLVLSLGSSSAGASAAELGGNYRVRELAPHTTIISEVEPFNANILLAEMPDDALLLVNAPATEESTREILMWIRSRFGWRRLVVINTHFHLDAVGGNALLIESGAEVYGSTQTAALVRERGAAVRDDLVHMYAEKPELSRRFAATRVVPPPHVFEPSAGLTLHFGDEEVRVIYPGPAHAPDNLVVNFPKRHVLFGGCMVKGESWGLGYLGSADTAKWPAAIAVLKALSPQIVIPGHGSRTDAEQLDNTLALLARHESASKN